MLNRRKYTIAFISWMVLITVLSLIPLPVMDRPGIEIPNMDKGVHVVFYLVASVFGCFFLRELREGRLSLPSTLGLIVFSLLGYGILIEVIQLEFTTWRSGEIADVVANILGALAGGGIVWLLFSGKSPLKWKN